MKNKLKSQIKIPILMYHEIYSPKCPDLRYTKIHPNFCIEEEQFLEQVAFLRYNRYKTLTLNELVNIDLKKEQRWFEKMLVITFDDGYVSNFNIAYPLLKKHNMIGNFFVVVNKIGQNLYMNWSQLTQMGNDGMGIYSHTMSHCLLETLEISSMQSEISNSKKTLEEKLARKIDFISYPNGSCNRKVMEVVKEAGYQGACNSEMGYFNKGTNNFAIPRFTIKTGWNLETFKKILQKNKWFLFKIKISELFKKGLRNSIGRKRYDDIYIKMVKIYNSRLKN